MRHDTVTIGTVSGLIGTAVFHTVEWVARLAGLQFTTMWQVAADIFVRPELINTRTGYLYGIIGEFGLGAVFGVIVAHVLRFTGKDYYLVKGLVIGFLFLVGMTGGAQMLLSIAPQVQGEPTTVVMTGINLAILGTVSAWIVARYASFVDTRRPRPN